MKHTSLCALALTGATACSPFVVRTPPPRDPIPSPNSVQATRAEDAFSAPLMRVLLAPLAAPSGVPGYIRLFARSPCHTADGVLPYVYPRWRTPRAGTEIAVDWVTRACRPFPDELMLLAVSFRPAEPGPADLSPWGHTGCWLLVNPDFLILPGPGSILSRDEPGRMSLRWTPGLEWIGQTVFAQALVATAAGPNGWLVSPGIEIRIGS